MNMLIGTEPLKTRAGEVTWVSGLAWLLVLVMLTLSSLAAIAQTPTAEQLAIFKSLPPETQKQLLDEMLKEQGKTPAAKSQAETTASPAAKPEAKADDLNLRIRPKFEGDIVLRAGDSLLVQVSPQAGPSGLSGQELADRTARGNPYRLNRQGALQLPGLDPIPLGGLTVGEAMQRLASDVSLRGLGVSLTLLPLDPQGTDALKPFGYDLFREGAGRMTPAMNVPVPAEYVVGPGDVLEVQTYGKEAGRYSLEVGRDGRIDFPELGPIAVAGQRFETVRTLIEQRVSEQLIGVEVSVSMGELRGIQVFVLGDAERPGSYASAVPAIKEMTSA